MKIQYCSKALLASVLAAGLALPAVGADSTVSVSQVAFGTIVGIVTNAVKVGAPAYWSNSRSPGR